MRFAVSSSRLVPSRNAVLDDRYRLEPPTKEKITRDDEKRYENALQIRQGPGETKTGNLCAAALTNYPFCRASVAKEAL